jgi:hypothetical protein
MSVEVLTKEDLQVFRRDLLEDISNLLTKNKPDLKVWLKAKEVRKLLNISPGTLLRMRAKRELRYSKIGGTYYYCDQDIQKMLANAGNIYD